MGKQYKPFFCVDGSQRIGLKIETAVTAREITQHVVDCSYTFLNSSDDDTYYDPASLPLGRWEEALNKYSNRQIMDAVRTNIMVDGTDSISFKTSENGLEELVDKLTPYIEKRFGFIGIVP